MPDHRPRGRLRQRWIQPECDLARGGHRPTRRSGIRVRAAGGELAQACGVGIGGVGIGGIGGGIAHWRPVCLGALVRATSDGAVVG